MTTGRVARAAPDAESADPAFPGLHGRPPAGWVNDPHGCIAVDGRYHVFFQHNPDAPRHERIRWGHMSSADLAHWEPEPIALVNRPGEADALGCWTGCIVDDDGTPTALYSAVADPGAQSVVMLARSDRELREWRQGRRPAFGFPQDPAVTHARDPFVLALGDRRYAIQGAGSYVDGGAARVLVYACDDLENWSELGPLVSAADDPVAARIAPAQMWECPNLFRLGGRWVLTVSRWRRAGGASVTEDVRYMVGHLRLTPDGPRFRATGGGVLDRGPAFYAPQVLPESNRTLIWGWAREHGRTLAEIDAAGWAGTLTFARELRLDGDTVVSAPAPELDVLRRAPLPIAPDEPFSAAAFDVELPPGDASLWLLDRDEERLVVQLAVPDVPLTRPRILVDGSIVEAFDGSGVPFTTRAYPGADSRWLLRVARPAGVSAWTLGLAT